MSQQRSAISTFVFLGILRFTGGCEEEAPPEHRPADTRSDGRAGANVYTAKVVESTNVNVTIPGMTVIVLDWETGAPGASVTSNSAGEVSLDDVGDNLAVFVRAKPPLYTDTYGFGPTTSGLVRVGTVSSAVLVPTLAEYVPLDDATPVAGNVVWADPETGKEEFVGCATVSGEGAKDVSYFSGALPTSARNRANTQPDRGNNETEAGKYFVGNLSAPGTRTLTATVAGEVVGSITFPTFPRKDAPLQDLGGKQGHANVVLVSIYAETPENPTPADCN